MFKKIASILVIIPCCLLAEKFEDHLVQESEDLKYVQTSEDKKRLGFFSALFDMAQKREQSAGSIPKTLHFIWLGPEPFPKNSALNIRGWIDRHPNWKVKFWTDQSLFVPDDRMEVRVFDAFPLGDLKEYYFRCDNFGERSEILRYAILLDEGGVYIDHDVISLKAIDSLQEEHDFFCGLEPLGPSILSSSINPSPHLIAASPQHPILKSSKKWLMTEWERLESQFPGNDSSAIYNRVQHRSFRALSIGIKESPSRSSRKDVVFPPDYFSLSESKNALFAQHLHLGSWYQKTADKEVEQLCKQVKMEFSTTFTLILILTFLNIAIGGLLIYRIFATKKRRRRA